MVHAGHVGRLQATSLRAARQNSGNFAIIFARLFRKICVTSARHSSFFACSKQYRLGEEMQRYSEVLETHVGRMLERKVFVRAERQNSGNFAFFSRDFGAKFA